VRAPGSPDAAATSGSGSPSVWATSYLGIPQPGHGNAAVVAERDTCMARIRGGDAFRTGLPRLFKGVGPFWKPEASGKPCGGGRYLWLLGRVLGTEFATT
jgi:hypothetical protein